MTREHRLAAVRRRAALFLSGLALGLIAATFVSAQEPFSATNHAAPAAAAPPVSRPAGFTVERYLVSGNPVLSPDAIAECFTNRFGTNVTVDTILKGASELQLAYRARGYQTVSVTLPQQTLTNGTVHVQVFAGRLAEILVLHNRYFSSNNVVRALPSLHTNLLLNSIVFQAELDRANANRDRQIYPRIEPGPEPNTTSLILDVKDRLPLHGKLELNNKSTPGTPDLRLEASAVYNNLWQLEHSLGVQYSMSPGYTKSGDWNPYDLPLIANYSAFYRLPLLGPSSIAETVETRPSDFGYDEASRRFRLPPPSGQPELNIYASRSTIDTGVATIFKTNVFTEVGTNGQTLATLDRQDVHRDVTINEDVGFRVSQPLPSWGPVRSGISAGLDYKAYRLSSYATNKFISTEFGLLDQNNNPLPPQVFEVDSPVPTGRKSLNYAPLSVRWDGGWADKHGSTSFGVGYAPNLWYSGGKSNFQSIAGTTNASGFWHVVSGTFTREQLLPGSWHLTLHADGQWASEPLISNEQFGIGGLAGVRGYREGEIFGDSGWRGTVELKSPAAFLGMVDGTLPMHVQGSTFIDYGQSYRIDPAPGQRGMIPMSGVGFGMAASIGSTWEMRLMLAWPLLSTPGVRAGETRAYFAVSGQF